VLHQIGVGALGPVFRTYEPTRDRLVAVKVFRLDVIPEQARTLTDELARAADAGLFHPSIVEPQAFVNNLEDRVAEQRRVTERDEAATTTTSTTSTTRPPTSTTAPRATTTAAP
jgi:hypothetical protein